MAIHQTNTTFLHSSIIIVKLKKIYFLVIRFYCKVLMSRIYAHLCQLEYVTYIV